MYVRTMLFFVGKNEGGIFPLSVFVSDGTGFDSPSPRKLAGNMLNERPNTCKWK